MHHMPMFSTFAAILFMVATALAIALHWYNQMRPGKLSSLSKVELIGMFRQMERNMLYDCGVMIFMSFHALGWLHGVWVWVAGWIIVGTRLYIAFRAWRRATRVYGLKDEIS